MDKEKLREYRLMEKYGKIWRQRVQKGLLHDKKECYQCLKFCVQIAIYENLHT